MNTALVEEAVVVQPSDHDGGRSRDDFASGDGGSGKQGPAASLYQTGVWFLLIPILMLFMGLTSSLVVRQGASDDWVPIQIPPILGFNTALLLLSSLTFEKARRSAKTASFARLGRWLWATNALALAFLAGQLAAWKQLGYHGAYLASNPSSSFFYVLTATHGIHLLGGMAGLVFLTLKTLRRTEGTGRQSTLNAMAIYWHFMGALWIYLLVLLIFWR